MAGQVIILMGPTGAGKGTQSRLLAEHLTAAHICSGDLLRADHNPEIMAKINAGGLAPSDYVEQLVGRALKAVDPEQAVILDGFPRRISDVHWLEANLPKLGRKINRVILLQVPRDETIERILARGRADDSRAAVEAKLDDYHDIIEPAIKHLRGRGLIVEVDGVGSIDAVAGRVAAAL